MKEFGAHIKSLREQKKISQRNLAKMLDISPTYMCKIERGEFAPPAEDVVKKIAEIFNQDSDLLLAKAGKISSDLISIIKENPAYYAEMIRKEAVNFQSF